MYEENILLIKNRTNIEDKGGTSTRQKCARRVNYLSKIDQHRRQRRNIDTSEMYEENILLIKNRTNIEDKGGTSTRQKCMRKIYFLFKNRT